MLILDNEQESFCPVGSVNEHVSYWNHICSGILYQGFGKK